MSFNFKTLSPLIYNKHELPRKSHVVNYYNTIGINRFTFKSISDFIKHTTKVAPYITAFVEKEKQFAQEKKKRAERLKIVKYIDVEQNTQTHKTNKNMFNKKTYITKERLVYNITEFVLDLVSVVKQLNSGLDEDDLKNAAVVKKLILEFLSTKMKVIKGNNLWLSITFKETYARYNMPKVFVNSVADVEAALDLKLAQWMQDQVDYDGDERWTAKKVFFYIQDRKGGCFESRPHIAGIETKKLLTKIFTPLNQHDNNCAIWCLQAFSKSNKTKTGKLQKINLLKEDLEKITEIRKTLFTHTNMLGDEDMTKLSNHFKIGIEIYINDGKKFVLSKSINTKLDKTAKLLLLGNHYNLIRSEELLNLEKCQNCSHYRVNLEEHLKECQYCHKCKQAYQGIHLSKTCEFNKNYKIIPGQNSVKIKKEEQTLTALDNIIIADFETFPSEIDEHQVYATAHQVNSDKIVMHKGKNCMDSFVDDLLALDKKKKYTLVFYNGSRYDLYFLFKKLVDRKIHVDTIFADGAYKMLRFNNVTTFDLNLHLPGSLKYNCESFKLDKSKSKSDFDHTKIKSWEDVNKHENEWQPYLKLDIVSLGELYKIYANNSFNLFKVNVNKYMTLSSMGYSIWRTTLEKKIDLLPYDWDMFVRRSVYGGRCYPVKQYFESKNKNDYLVDLDVVSLYPTAMAKDDHEFLPNMKVGMYPTGKYYIEDREDRFQMYIDWINKNQQIPYCHYVLECDITPNKSLVNAVLPRKGSNMWTLENIEHGVYNSIDLKRAIAHGYKITKIYKFIGWREQNRPFDSYINMMFDKKQKAAKGSAEYIIAKLLMNSLYGKMIQAPIVSKSKIITTLKEFNSIQESNIITAMKFLDDEHLFVEYEKIQKDFAVTKPSYLGSLILGYSRAIMDKYIDAMGGYTNLESSFYRTDTDSLIVHKKQEEKLKKYVGKDLGLLDYDIDGKIYKFAEVQPKVYICEYETKDGENKTHVKAKGFSNQQKDMLVFNDFKAMLFKTENTGTETFKGGKIERNGETIKLTLDSKIKKIGWQPNSKQQEYGMSSIINQKFERTLNKTKWTKRTRVVGDKNLASLPIGYEKA